MIESESSRLSECLSDAQDRNDGFLQEFEGFPRRALSTVTDAFVLYPKDDSVIIKLMMTLTADSESLVAEVGKTQDACIAKLLNMHGRLSP